MQPAAADMMATATSASAARMHAERRLTVALETYATLVDSEPADAGPDQTLLLRAALTRARAALLPVTDASSHPRRSSLQSLERDGHQSEAVNRHRSVYSGGGESAFDSETDDFAYNGSPLALITQ